MSKRLELKVKDISRAKRTYTVIHEDQLKILYSKRNLWAPSESQFYNIDLT